MKKLIHFREQGCQAVQTIIKKSLDSINNTEEIIFKNSAVNKVDYKIDYKIVYCSLEKTDNEIFWQEASEKAGISFKSQDSLLNVDEKSLLILNESSLHFLEEIENNSNEKTQPYAVITDSSKEDFFSPFALGAFSTLIYTSLRTKKDISSLSIGWIGDAGTHYENIMNSLLNSTICLRNMLGISFEQNEEEAEICAPHVETLSFVMQAGAKIFLSYEPNLLDEDTDLLYLSKWTFKGEKTLNKTHSHPYTYDAIKNTFSKNPHIVSLIPEIPSSEINTELYKKTAFITRLATLSYFLEIKK